MTWETSHVRGGLTGQFHQLYTCSPKGYPTALNLTARTRYSDASPSEQEDTLPGCSPREQVSSLPQCLLPAGWSPRQQQVMSNLLRIRAVAQQHISRQEVER